MSLLYNLGKLMSILLIGNYDMKYILLLFIIVYIIYNYKWNEDDISKITNFLFKTKKDSNENIDIEEEEDKDQNEDENQNEDKYQNENENENEDENESEKRNQGIYNKNKSKNDIENGFRHDNKRNSIYVKKTHSIVNPKCKDIKNNPYPNKIEYLKKKYNNSDENNEYTFKINENTCTTPFFHLRKYGDCPFFYNFRIADFGPEKISSLIMCRDIYKWMSSSSLSHDDLPDNYYPIYMVLKVEQTISIFEYLKFFVRTKENGTRIAFVQKGNHYLEIENYVADLLNRNVISDLLDGTEYITYKLDSSENVSSFLDRLLSLLTVSDKSIGSDITIDYEIIHENKRAFKYFFNSLNGGDIQSNSFNTTI